MMKPVTISLWPALFIFGWTIHLQAQITSTLPPTEKTSLFASDEVLPITLSGPIRQLMANRLGSPRKFPCVLSSGSPDSRAAGIPVEMRTRGHFRRQNLSCQYPPLLIDFADADTKQSSIFHAQQKMKLVMPCAHDDYIIREWLVYKLYNLVTPLSFRARLVEVTLGDDKTKKQQAPFYGILLEEETQLAQRNQLRPIEKQLNPKQTQRSAFLTMAVFEYLIGNTDWSVQYQQNVKLLIADSSAAPIPVPYDFDHAGIVSAPYARPAAELQMQSIRERRYRGYCLPNLQPLGPVIAQYQQLKDEFYKLYKECTLLDPQYLKSTLQYLDEFYETLNDPKKWQKEFAYPCDPNGTGGVIIKGLKEDKR